jgi:hypothetical protein
MPKLPSLAGREGFAVDFWIRFKELISGQSILDTRDANGKGIALVTSDRSTIKLILHDGRTEYEWDSDFGAHSGTLKVNAWQHVVVIVDGGPRIVSFVVAGVFNDGGALRDYGWGRFPKEMGDVNGTGAWFARWTTSVAGVACLEDVSRNGCSAEAYALIYSSVWYIL